MARRNHPVRDLPHHRKCSTAFPPSFGRTSHHGSGTHPAHQGTPCCRVLAQRPVIRRYRRHWPDRSPPSHRSLSRLSGCRARRAPRHLRQGPSCLPTRPDLSDPPPIGWSDCPPSDLRPVTGAHRNRGHAERPVTGQVAGLRVPAAHHRAHHTAAAGAVGGADRRHAHHLARGPGPAHAHLGGPGAFERDPLPRVQPGAHARDVASGGAGLQRRRLPGAGGVDVRETRFHGGAEDGADPVGTVWPAASPGPDPAVPSGDGHPPGYRARS